MLPNTMMPMQPSAPMNPMMLQKLYFARSRMIYPNPLPAQMQSVPMMPTGRMMPMMVPRPIGPVPKSCVRPVPLPGRGIAMNNMPAPSMRSNRGADGLELLRAVSLRLPQAAASSNFPPARSSPSRSPKPDENEPAGEVEEEEIPNGEKRYIEKLRELDIVSGRGGKSNHHPGNKKFREVVSEMKYMYRNMATKTVKTDLSRAIVDHVCSYGGRFVKQDDDGRFSLLSKLDARKKTSQALRETKAIRQK